MRITYPVAVLQSHRLFLELLREHPKHLSRAAFIQEPLPLK